MSVNVGAITVGMRVNLAEFQSGMKQATAMASSETALMSARMKSQNREGAESLRLWDEAFGIHVSRPLTRIISQLPGVGTALQSAFAVGAGAAIGMVIFDSLEKFSKKMEEVAEKPRAISEAWGKVTETFEGSSASLDKAIASIEAHLAGLAGGPLAKLDVELRNLGTSAMLVKSEIDKVFKATEEAQSKQGGAGLGDTLLRGASTIWSGLGNLFSGPAAQQEKQLEGHFKDLKIAIDSAFDVDQINKTHEAVGYLNQQLDKEFEKLKLIQLTNSQGYSSDTALQKQQQVVAMLAEAADLAQKGQRKDTLEEQAKRADRAAAAAELAKKQADELLRGAEAAHKFDDEMKKLAVDAIGDPFDKWEYKFSVTLDEMSTKFKALPFKEQQARASEFAKGTYDAIHIADLELNKLMVDMMKVVAPSSSTLPGLGTWGAAMPAPTHPAGENAAAATAAADLAKFQGDVNAQLKLAAEAYQDALTPMDRYKLKEAELNYLEKEHLISVEAEKAALQKASDELVKAESHTQQLIVAQQKLLEKTDSVTAGFKAFLIQIQLNAQTGKFTFDILNQGLTGFEDNLATVLTGGKARWADYFKSLEMMAVKFALQKGIAALFNLGGWTGQGGAPTTSGTSTGGQPGGFAGILHGVFGGLGGGGSTASSGAALQAAATSLTAAGTSLTAAGTALSAAATTLTTSGTSLMSASTALSAAAAQLTAAAAALQANSTASSFSQGANSGGGYGGYGGGNAEGGDVTPGMSYTVGERGPELLTMGSRAAGFITPNSGQGAKPGNVYYVDARGAQGDMVQTIHRAIRLSEDRAVVRSVTSMDEIRRRTLSRY